MDAKKNRYFATFRRIEGGVGVLTAKGISLMHLSNTETFAIIDINYLKCLRLFYLSNETSQHANPKDTSSRHANVPVNKCKSL